MLGKKPLPRAGRLKKRAQTKLEFVVGSDGILVRPVDEDSFKELGGSASRKWTVDEMLKRLDELRRENV